TARHERAAGVARARASARERTRTGASRATVLPPRRHARAVARQHLRHRSHVHDVDWHRPADFLLATPERRGGRGETPPGRALGDFPRSLGAGRTGFAERLLYRDG